MTLQAYKTQLRERLVFAYLPQSDEDMKEIDDIVAAVHFPKCCGTEMQPGPIASEWTCTVCGKGCWCEA